MTAVTDFPDTDVSTFARLPESPSDLSEQVELFLDSVLLKVRPDWIVTLERKGTALLRTYTETGRPNKVWPGWHRVLSQHALDDLQSHHISGRVLVLDDAMHLGRQVALVLKQLRKLGVSDHKVTIAAFALHQDCRAIRPDHWWYGHLDDSTFRTIRGQLIRLFQHQGSLLLDTEHVELTVRANCSQLELFRAFSAVGTCVYHVSCGGRTNLTVFQPRILDRTSLEGAMPEGTLLDEVVHKIRVVERGGGTYSIIPIFYPAVLSDDVKVALSPAFPPALADLSDSDDKIFHLVGIFAALRLFRTSVACLRELHWERRLQFDLALSNSGFEALEHLLALFPGLDVRSVATLLATEIEAGLSHKLKASERIPQRDRIFVDATDGTENGDTLDRFHWLALRTISEAAREPLMPAHGVPMGYLFAALQRHLGLPSLDLRTRAIFSAAIDRAVDDGDVGTEEGCLRFDDGRRRITRLFSLDNEVVREDVLRAISRFGHEIPWRTPYAQRP